MIDSTASVNYQTRKSGYTLIELLLYVSVLGTLLGAVSGFYALTQTTQAKAQVIAEVDQQGATAIESISHTLRNSNGINTPAAGASAATTSLSLVSAPVNPTIYDLASGAIRIKEGAATAVALTNSRVQVTNLLFKNLSSSGTDGVMQISFTISSTNASGRSEYAYQKNFTTTVALRQ